ncbi:unnamed protein product, partial [marine sediment metagenome]
VDLLQKLVYDSAKRVEQSLPVLRGETAMKRVQMHPYTKRCTFT